jgi:hypothetical protein
LPHASATHALQAPQVHDPGWQLRVPVAPQPLAQPCVVPRRHSKLSSVAPLQSSSAPLHASTAPTTHVPHEHAAEQVCVPPQAPTVHGCVRPGMHV